MYSMRVRDAVIKLISQNVEFDWMNPYKHGRDFGSMGTGFFIDNKGHILTCAHVVRYSVRILFTVASRGEEKFEARVLSTCPEKDIALLKTDYKNTNFLKLGDSDKVKQGANVKVIGFPLGSEKTMMTSGVISGRSGTMLQTDAPINFGNSGGPLLDEKNKVVGINASIIAVANNMGYATPIHDFIVMRKQMFNSGKTIKIIDVPSLMVRASHTDKWTKIFLKIGKECSGGMYLGKVHDSSSFKKAGIKSGDVICEFDGLKVDNFGDCSVPWGDEKISLGDIMHRYNVGDNVEVKCWSDGSFKKFTVSCFGEHKTLKVVKRYPPLEKVDYEVFGGMVLMELAVNHIEVYTDSRVKIVCEENKRYLEHLGGLGKRSRSRLILTNILFGSYISSTYILNKGDVITHINGFKVGTLEELRSAALKFSIINGKKFISIKTHDNAMVAIPAKLIVDEDKLLSDRFGYKEKELIKGIRKAVK